MSGLRQNFWRKSQGHSCVSVLPEALTENLAKETKALFEYLLDKITGLDDIQISPAKSSVFFKHGSTFAAVKPMKRALNVEFHSPEEIKDSMIHKMLCI